MGTNSIRLAKVRPEVPDDASTTALAPFETVMAIVEKMCWKTYRYSLANGIFQITLMLPEIISTHLTVTSHRALLPYEGLPAKLRMWRHKLSLSDMPQASEQWKDTSRQTTHNV